MLIVGLGGTTRPYSTTEVALSTALEATERTGATTRLLGAKELDLPLFDPSLNIQDPRAVALVDTVRAADGLILASPGYHGTLSGLVKNALDYLELCRSEPRPYLNGIPVGCIAVSYGWQAAVNTLRTLRDIVHGLQAWPNPIWCGGERH